MSNLRPIVDAARSNSDKVKDLLSCSIENLSDGQVVGELFRQVGLTFDEEWITLSEGKRQKMRRINQQAWDQAWQFVHYRQSLKLQPEPEATTVSETSPPPTVIGEAAAIRVADHPPGHSFSEASRGGDQKVSSDLSVSAASIPSLELVPIAQSEVLAPLLEAVQAVEECRSLKDFLSVGQRLFRGKSEQFCKSVIQFLSPESFQRVIGWTGQPLAPSVSG